MIMQANPSKDFKMQKICEVCQHVFDVEFNKAIKIEGCEQQIASNYKTLFFGGERIQKVHEHINMYYAVCPNCGHEEKIFYVPTGKIKMTEQVVYSG